MMKRIGVLCVVAVLVMAASASAVDYRYAGSGDWDSDYDTTGIGWYQEIAGVKSTYVPDSTSNLRANYANGVISLARTADIARYQLGVNEGGTFHILDGGTLNVSSNSKVGNNGSCTGILSIDAGGVVNEAAGWTMIAGSTTVTGIADVSGTWNITGHLWMATGAGSSATLEIRNGGVVNTGNNIGLGTIAPADLGNTGGIATINVHDGGTLNLTNIHGNLETGDSIRDGSSLNIFGSGIVTLPGNFVAVMEGYIAAGGVFGDGIEGGVAATYDEGTNLTTVAVPEPATMALLGLGGLLLRRKK